MPSPQEEDLFERALDVPRAERSAWIAGACADDEPLRLKLETLLRAHDDAEGFLDAPATDLSSEPRCAVVPEEKPGDRIGRYKLLQKIGEGGCGAVYMAEQEEAVRRRVALKVIKLGMDTKAVIARFEAERQALARMEHPNIARVLDAGATSSGRPFFVMELVRGLKITDYCDQNNLSTEARLGLFIKVCQAIQHAHQKGIIHRDIKPSNILVTLHDGEPVPKVIDFGIAKATQGRLTDATLFTAFEQFIGTPAYVSPEQAEMSGLDIDTRSDIYSLGVLLYELLAGRTPFDTHELLRAGIDEMRRQIREQEPPRPSLRLRTLDDSARTTVALRRGTDAPRLGLRLKGDLDWIVMRCLEKDRSRRYETANALAMDIQRHLQNEPVLARPPSTAYLMQKLIRRHRLGFAAGAAIAITLILGSFISTTAFLRARESLQRAQAAEKLAREEKHAAENARAAEAKLLAQAQADEQKAKKESALRAQIATLLTEITKDIGELLAFEGDTKPLVHVLNLFVARMKNEAQNQPEIYEVLGGVFFNIGQWARAEALMREALAIHRSRPGSPIEEARTRNYLGLILNAEDKFGEAEDHLREALAKLQQAGSPDSRRLLLQCRANLGWVLSRQGHVGEAAEMIRDALARQRELFGDDDIDSALALRRLSLVYVEEGQVEKAEETLNEALRITRKSLGHDHLEVVTLLNYLAVVHAIQVSRNPAKIQNALLLYREAVSIRQRLKNPNSTAPLAPESLTAVLEQHGTLAEIVAMLKEARRFGQRHYKGGSWEDAFVVAAIAWVQLSEKRWAEAEASARECHAVREKLRPDDWSTFHARNMIGAALAGQGKFAEAEPLLLEGYRGMKQREATIPGFHISRLAEGLQRIVDCYTAWGRPEEAARWRVELVRELAAATR